MKILSSQPYKGTRDFYPEDKRIQNYIFEVWHRVARRFGYEEYGAPTLEPLEVYAAKSGQEIVNEQTYTFEDRGGRTVAIRPEMTPTISRMVAARRQEMAYPARLYSIANFMRYERPQRGREREFWQFNVDIFGADGVEAEAEIIAVADGVMKEFGAKSSDYEIKINNRKLIDFIMTKYLGLDSDSTHKIIKLFDRKNKISQQEFEDQAKDILGDKAEDGLNKINQLIQAKNILGLPEEVRNSESVAEIQKSFEILNDIGVENLVFDVTLMRGFDYYTGMVFEVFDTHPDNNRSLFGGGRYDGLVGLFGVEPLSAVGMAPGATMTELFLQVHGLLPKLSSLTSLYIATLGDVSKEANKLANELRLKGLNIELDISNRKIDKQIKTADKKGINTVLFIGEEEVKNNKYKLKNIDSGREYELDIAGIVELLKEK